MNGARHCVGGYSYRKANIDNWMVQLQPGTDTYKKVLAFNQNVRSLGGIQLQHTSLFGATFGGTHGTFFLQGVLSGAKFEHEQVAPSGFLDETYIRCHFPGVGEALDRGLDFNVLNMDLVNTYPKILSIGQAALNHHATLAVSEMEGIIGMHSTAKRLMEAGTKEGVALETARQLSVKQEPFWSEWSAPLMKFASRFSSEQLEEARDIRNLMFKASGEQTFATTECTVIPAMMLEIEGWTSCELPGVVGCFVPERLVTPTRFVLVLNSSWYQIKGHTMLPTLSSFVVPNRATTSRRYTWCLRNLVLPRGPWSCGTLVGERRR